MPRCPSRLHWLACALVALAGAAAASAQPLYIIRKSQVFIETNVVPNGTGVSVSSVAPPTGGFMFTAQAATAATLFLPSGAAQPLPAVTGGGFELTQAFASQAAMDAAYPNGTYRMAGAGLPDLALDLTVDSYTASGQAMTRTNWSNSLNIVDPAVANTFTFGFNSGYNTVGVASRMTFRITGLTDSVALKNDIVSKPGFGLPATTGQFTSFAVPAGTFVSGHVYQAELEWDNATTFDTTTIAGGGVLALYSRILRFYIVARGANDPAPAPPVLAGFLTGQAATLGGTVTFPLAVTVDGVAPSGAGGPSVLWYFNGRQLAIDGTKYALVNGLSLAIRDVAAADAGRYYAEVVNAGGVVRTAAVALTLPTSITIVRQPSFSVIVAAGSTASFSVAAVASTALSYQWQRNGVNLPASFLGSTGPTLVIPEATEAQAGSYTVVISNGTSTVTSQVGLLAVVPVSASGEPARLINLSILTPLASGETLSMGTVLGGGGTAGTKALLARAAGPSLAQLGVAGTLPDPSMTLNATGRTPATVVATNNDWGGSAAMTAAFVSVGAFPYASATSKDAAILEPALAPGNYTVQVRDAGTGGGMVIAELYDATAPGTFSATTPRLINVSVLKPIAAGTSLTVGFVIRGTTAKTVLIRAIGPGLAALGVGGAMPDPQLTLNNVGGDFVVAANNDWAGLTAISQTASRVGAFTVSDPASKDAMVLATLAAGSYTVDVSPATAAGGVAIVEVYEVP